MLYHRLDFAHWYRRSPYGERGLKSTAWAWTIAVATVALLTESVD